MATRLEHVRTMTQHFLGRVAGNFDQSTVHMHDHTAAIAHQHAFASAVKDHSRLAQALLILALALQARAHTQKTAKASPGEKNQHGTEKSKNIAIYQLPLRQLR